MATMVLLLLHEPWLISHAVYSQNLTYLLAENEPANTALEMAGICPFKLINLMNIICQALGKYQRYSVILDCSQRCYSRTCDLHKRCSSEKSSNKAEMFLYQVYFLLLGVFPKWDGWDVQYLFVDGMIT